MHTPMYDTQLPGFETYWLPLPWPTACRPSAIVLPAGPLGSSMEPQDAGNGLTPFGFETVRAVDVRQTQHSPREIL